MTTLTAFFKEWIGPAIIKTWDQWRTYILSALAALLAIGLGAVLVWFGGLTWPLGDKWFHEILALLLYTVLGFVCILALTFLWNLSVQGHRNEIANLRASQVSGDLGQVPSNRPEPADESWRSLSCISLSQAACLASGIVPEQPIRYQPAQVELQKLQNACGSGKLAFTYNSTLDAINFNLAKNLYRAPLPMSRAMVSRADLKVYYKDSGRAMPDFLKQD